MAVKYTRMSEELKKYAGSGETFTTKQQMMDFLSQQSDALGDLVGKLLWQPNTEYQQNAFVFSANLPSGAIAKCTIAGTSGTDEPAWNDNIAQDGNIEWEIISVEDMVNPKSFVPVGTMQFTINPNIELGWLPMQGDEYSREVYTDLWEWAQTQEGFVIGEEEWQTLNQNNDGNVPFFSTGDGTSSFRVPSIKCWVKGKANDEDVYLPAGLPNITGSVGTTSTNTSGTFLWEFNTSSLEIEGAFEITESRNAKGADDSDHNYTAPKALEFNASKSNPIYGRTDIVQPASVTGVWIIRAYGEIAKVGTFELENAVKLVEEYAKVADEYTKEIKQYDYVIEADYDNETKSWYKKWKSGKLEQGGVIQKDTSLASGGFWRTQVSFLQPFKDEEYNILLTGGSTAGTSAGNEVSYGLKTVTNFELCHYNRSQSAHQTIEDTWYAYGNGR